MRAYFDSERAANYDWRYQGGYHCGYCGGWTVVAEEGDGTCTTEVSACIKCDAEKRGASAVPFLIGTQVGETRARLETTLAELQATEEQP